MAPFSGYSMPINYQRGILHEHKQTRTKVGLFDASHMGQLTLLGKNTSEILEKLVCSNIRDLKNGKSKYTMFTNERGGIIDDLIVSKMEDELFIVVNASQKYSDFEMLRSAKSRHQICEFKSERALIAMQGPMAQIVLKRFCPNIAEMTYMSISKIKINDVPLDKWNKCFKELNCQDFQDLYIKVGLSEIFVAVVVNKLLQDINNETINKLSITKTKGMAINFAQCCYPIPGDEVTGVLTTMRGLVLHRTNCSQLEHIKEKNSQWMEVDWQSDDSEQFEVGISCIVENRSGRLAAIANTVANLGVNIENIEQQRRPDSTRLFHIVVVVSNIIELNNVLDKLNNLPHVVSAGRL